MKSFQGRIAVITGGGTGMGRELARKLAAAGCNVAICDVNAENMEQTRNLCLQASTGVRITCHVADVSVEADLERFRNEVMREHETDCIHLLFNNAGIGGAGSMIVDDRESWEKTFDICWYGVYYGTRVFLPLLLAAEEGHVINTSSVNGFWATLGPHIAHSAYSAAKFAVKGFTEALINDFKLNAPHLQVSLVMPGHIGTSIVTNSGKMLGNDPKEMSDEEIQTTRESYEARGADFGNATNEQLRQALLMQAERFRDNALTSAEEAATIILDGVRAGEWRILVGPDAQALDRLVREDAEGAYSEGFYERLLSETTWPLGELQV